MAEPLGMRLDSLCLSGPSQLVPQKVLLSRPFCTILYWPYSKAKLPPQLITVSDVCVSRASDARKHAVKKVCTRHPLAGNDDNANCGRIISWLLWGLYEDAVILPQLARDGICMCISFASQAFLRLTFIMRSHVPRTHASGVNCLFSMWVSVILHFLTVHSNLRMNEGHFGSPTGFHWICSRSDSVFSW